MSLTDSPFGEGDAPIGCSKADPHTRTFFVEINSTLKDLCLQQNKSTWKPTAAVIESALTQKKFNNLNGETKQCGNLKSVVMHDFSVSNLSSNLDVAVGANISSVDANVHAANGATYSMVVPPNASIANQVSIQKDSVDLAYEFSEKFSGYTADNLDEKGVHKVQQRNFVLVAAEHPIMAAIGENQHALQSNEFTVMPEGLVKVSTELYDTFLPLVKQQVRSQIQVRNLSSLSASFTPVGFSKWPDYRQQRVLAAQAPIKARMARLDKSDEQGFAALDEQSKEIGEAIDLEPCRVSFSATVTYNFLDDEAADS
jgi:hypothetical protein